MDLHEFPVFITNHHHNNIDTRPNGLCAQVWRGRAMHCAPHGKVMWPLLRCHLDFIRTESTKGRDAEKTRLFGGGGRH